MPFDFGNEVIVRQASCVLLLSCCSLVACAYDASDPAETPSESDSDVDVATAVSSAVADSPVYLDGALASPWRNWSWSSTVALANAEAPLVANSKSQIKVTSKTAWAALALANPTGDMLVDDYDSLQFDVRGPAAVTLQLAIEPLAGGTTAVRANVAVTKGWKRQTVKLSALAGSLTKFGKIDWIVPTTGKTFYIDNVKLVARATPATPGGGTAPVTDAKTSPTYPVAPITGVTKGDVVNMTYAGGSYSMFVPQSYDSSHGTPTALLLWSHGCGGNAYGDAWVVSPGGNQSWITASLGGRDGKCWNVSTDSALVLGAIDDVSKRLNIDPRRVIIGGYSSGGDLSYRTAFNNAKRFAGIIAENTSPFRDTGAAQAALISAAAWKLNVAHLAHTGDTTYPIARVRTETDALKAAGFPVTVIEMAGTHYDQDTATTGTTYDLRKYLLPFIDAGWQAPL